MISSGESGGGFSLVEHPMSAHALAAPLHRHTREDEYSYVVEGRVGALLGDDVRIGGPGDLILSRVTSGIRSGTQARSPHEFLKSSLRLASSNISLNSSISAAPRRPIRWRCERCRHGTASK
jgi:hypothetical protein